MTTGLSVMNPVRPLLGLQALWRGQKARNIQSPPRSSAGASFKVKEVAGQVLKTKRLKLG